MTFEFFYRWFPLVAFGALTFVSGFYGSDRVTFAVSAIALFLYIVLATLKHRISGFSNRSSIDRLHLDAHLGHGSFIAAVYPIIRRLYARRTDLTSSINKVIRYTEVSATEIGERVSNISSMAKAQLGSAVAISTHFSPSETDATSLASVLRETLKLLHSTLQAQDELLEMNAQLKASLQSASESAARITENALAMKELSTSTKLLSFNARLEASRAGQLGLGFGVVADSVNKLSSQTQDLAHEIDVISGQINREMNELDGRLATVNAATSLRQNTLKDSLASISHATTVATENARTLSAESMERAKEIAQNINDIFAHLQFQDLTRQELERTNAKIEHSWGSEFQSVFELESRLLRLLEQLASIGIDSESGYPEINPHLVENEVATNGHERHQSSFGNVVLFSQGAEASSKPGTGNPKDAAAGELVMF